MPVSTAAHDSPKNRLDGLDMARFMAFAGMVLVNFKMVMGPDVPGGGWAGTLFTLLEGRAAATFVMLAGIGLGLMARRPDGIFTLTLRRAVFLLVAGLLNMLIFDADILHYYALYFVFGLLCIRQSTKALLALTLLLPFLFILLLLVLDYDAGWNWQDYSYAGFWTPSGFVRNLFFNGWHPVVPWLGFFLFGMILARLDLSNSKIRWWLLLGGGIVAIAGTALSGVLVEVGTQQLGDSEAALALFGASPIPPAPLYMISAGGAAVTVIGACLLLSPALACMGLLVVLTAPGRQALTLYIAHIYVGMSILEIMGLFGGQSPERVVLAAGMFCLTAMLYAWIWSRFYKRGPAEALMRRLAG